MIRNHTPSMGVKQAEQIDLYDLAHHAAEQAKGQSREGVRSIGRINCEGPHSVDVPTLEVPAEVEIDITDALHETLKENGEYHGQDVNAKYQRVYVGKNGHIYASFQTTTD